MGFAEKSGAGWFDRMRSDRGRARKVGRQARLRTHAALPTGHSCDEGQRIEWLIENYGGITRNVVRAAFDHDATRKNAGSLTPLERRF